jgi:hypothetical protein
MEETNIICDHFSADGRCTSIKAKCRMLGSGPRTFTNLTNQLCQPAKDYLLNEAVIE